MDYWREGRTAHVMLNRPDRLNAIDAQLPFQLQSAIQRANWDDEVTFSSPTDGGSVEFKNIAMHFLVGILVWKLKLYMNNYLHRGRRRK